MPFQAATQDFSCFFLAPRDDGLYLPGMDISELKGKTLLKIDRLGGDVCNELIFTCSGGEQYRMFHLQNCCESVWIEEIIGDLDDLIGAPLLMAEEVGSADAPKRESAESFTWTFYKLATIKGYVTLRWLGESNGYYSESVDFEKL